MSTTFRRFFTGRSFKQSSTHRSKAKQHFRPLLEAFEDRLCLAQNIWQPAGMNFLWSNDANWSLGHKPDNTEDAVLDGSADAWNQDVTVDIPVNVSYLLFKNNYLKTMTIRPGITLETANGFDLSGVLDPNQFTRINFDATTSKLQTNGGISFMQNFIFGGERGTVHVAAGTLELQGTTIQSSSKADFLIGTVFHVWNISATVFLLNGAGITIAAGAVMTMDASSRVVFDNGNSGSILENFGTFTKSLSHKGCFS